MSTLDEPRDLVGHAVGRRPAPPGGPGPSPWERFWFEPGPGWAYRVTAALVLGVAAISLAMVPGSFLDALGTSAPDRWQPVGFYALLPQPRGTWLDVAAVVVAGACAVAAVANRPWAYRLAALPAAYLIGFSNNFGKVNHGNNVLVVALLALAIGAYRVEATTEPDWRFRWPVQAARSAIGLMFLFAAVSKLRTAGLDWVVSDNMRNILAMESTLLRDVHLPAVAAWIASAPWRWQLAAVGALLGEALTIVGVVARRPWVRLPLVVNAIAVLAGLNLLLDLGGWEVLVLSLLLLDVGRTPRPGSRWRGPTLAVQAVVAAGVVAIVPVLQTNAYGWTAAALVLVLAAVSGRRMADEPVRR